MSSSTASKGYYLFSQLTDDDNIHMSFRVGYPACGSQPCNIQLSMRDAERLMDALLQSMQRYREQLQSRIVAIDDTVRDTLRKDAEARTTMLAALQYIVNYTPARGEDEGLSATGYDMALDAIRKATA